MRQPAILTNDKIASDYWKRHSKRLIDAELLTEATVDSFVLLCRVHSALTNHDPNNADDKAAVIKFVALSKQYQVLSRGFAMNTDKVKKEQKTEAAPDEFGL